MQAAKFGHDFPTYLVKNTNLILSVLHPVKFIFEIIYCDSLGHEMPASDNLRALPPTENNLEKRVL